MSYPTIKLARLPIGWDKQPQLFERYYDETMTQIEKTLNAILQIPIIQAALSVVKLSVAQQAIASSFPVGMTMTISSTGSLVISNHIRRYPDTHVDVAVTGGTIATGLAAGDVRSVSYDDLTRAGGAVTYVLTLDDTDAHISAAYPARHYVGYVSVPASGAPKVGAIDALRGAPSVNKFTEEFDGGTA